MTLRSKHSKDGLAQRYSAALQDGLARDASEQSAGSLGREAIAAGLDSVDLFKIHQVALAAAMSSTAASKKNNGVAKNAASFLYNALAPFGTADGVAIKRKGNLTQANALMHERALERSGLRRLLKREIGQREAAQEALKTSEQHYKLLLEKSIRMQEHLRRLSHEVLSAHEEERKKISRELHDEIGQSLTAINVRLAALKRETAANTKGLKGKISSTQRLLEKSMNAVHRFARELRPPLLDDLGLIPALKSYMQEFAARNPIPIYFKASAAVEGLESDKRTALYRVAQEALINIDRHAHASLVEVTLKRVGEHVRMEIHDDGRSFLAAEVFAASKPTRLGLLGMRERIEMVGGTFSIDSEPGKGTTVRALVPVQTSSKQRRKHRLIP